MALDSKKVKQPVKGTTGVNAATDKRAAEIMDFVTNHPNPMVKKNLQSIMQVAAEFDDNSKNLTTLSEVRKATKEFLKSRKVDEKSAGGLAGRLASRGYGKARR